MVSFLEFLIFLIVGLAAGFISGLLGIGGGMIVVPSLLVTFYLLSLYPDNAMQTAIGTSLAAMVLTAWSSAWAHWKHVNLSLFKALAPGIIFGAIVGAIIAHLLPTKHLQFVFGIFICLFGIYFLLTAKIQEIESKTQPHYLILSIIGVAIGAISSILGIGGGIITVPLLTFFGASLKHAISTSAVTGFLIAFFGAMHSCSTGYVYIPAFIIIGLAAAMMAPLGAKFAYTTSPIILKRVFGIYQIAIGLLMIWF